MIASMWRGLSSRLRDDPRVAIPSVLLLGLVTRLIGITSRPIWYDEAFSILFASKGPAAMMLGTLAQAGAGASEEHPLAYYSLLWVWMRVFGQSLLAVRLLSVLAAVALVFVAYLLASRLFGLRLGLAAGLLTALAPFQVHYGQEIRMYVWLALWLLLAAYCYLRGSQSAHWGWWAGFAVCAALAQYTHALASFFLAALALWPLATRNWRVLGRVAISGSAAVVAYLPWLVHLPAQFAKVDQNYWIARPGFSKLITLLLTFVTNVPLFGWQLAIGFFIALLLTVIAVRQTIRATRLHQRDAAAGVWLLYLAFAPPLVLLAFSQWIPVYVERALLPSGAIFCIWLSWALFATRLPRPAQIVGVALLAIAFALGLSVHASYAGFPYAPYRDITAALEAQIRPGDVVVHSNKLSMLPAVYYDPRLPETYVADPPHTATDTLAPGTQKVLGLIASPDIESAATNAPRVWFIIFAESNQEYIDAGAPQHPQLTWLMQRYSTTKVDKYGDLLLYLFTRNP